MNIYPRPRLRANIPFSEDLLREIFDEDVYLAREAEGLIRGSAVLDVGANIGAFSLLALHLGAARVFAIEPNPSNVEALRKNLSGRDAAEVLPVAAVGHAREMAIASDGAQAFVSDVTTITWIRKALGQDPTPPKVPGVTVSAIMAEHKIERIGFLKLDVEKAEFEVIDGILPEDMARIDFIAIELSPSQPGALGTMVEKLARTHSVRVIGSPLRGGYVYARRYGA